MFKNEKGISRIALILIIVLVVVGGAIVTVGIMSGNRNSDNGVLDSNQTSVNNESNENTNINKTKYESYTADYPKEDRTIDYYWNINTDGFDKNKFDGKISFYGTVIDYKITGKTLFENGYTLTEISNDVKDLFNIFDESDRDYTTVGALIKKQNKTYPVDYSAVSSPKFINLDKSDNFYSDNVEFYSEYHYTNKYADFVTETVESNVVFPYLNGIKYNDITIDDIIENMGVPTYVEGREDTVENSSTMLFSYVYVYDDYVFKFGFTHLGEKISQTSVEYMGIKTFNHVCRDYIDNDTYNTYTFKSKLEDEQNKYLKAINK